MECQVGVVQPAVWAKDALEVDHKIARDRHRITFGRQQYLKHHVRAM